MSVPTLGPRPGTQGARGVVAVAVAVDELVPVGEVLGERVVAAEGDFVAVGDSGK